MLHAGINKVKCKTLLSMLYFMNQNQKPPAPPHVPSHFYKVIKRVGCRQVGACSQGDVDLSAILIILMKHLATCSPLMPFSS